MAHHVGDIVVDNMRKFHLNSTIFEYETKDLLTQDMDSPRVAPPLHRGIDRHLPLGRPPPDLTPVASCIHRRLVVDEKRR